MNAFVYREYDQAALDEQYNARSAVPAVGAFLQRWRSTSEKAAYELPCKLDVPYGDSPAETLDVFHPVGGGPAPECSPWLFSGQLRQPSSSNKTICGRACIVE